MKTKKTSKKSSGWQKSIFYGSCTCLFLWGFAEENNKFDKYEFRTIDWSHEVRDGSILYVGDPKDMPHGNVLNIKFLNGQPAMELADRPNGAQ